MTTFHILGLIIWTFIVKGEEVYHHHCEDDKQCTSAQSADTFYYMYGTEGRTWNESEALCKSENLTMVNEKWPPRKVLEALVKDVSEAFNIWLGGNIVNLEKWTFVNKIPIDETLDSIQDSHNQKLCGVLTYTKRSNEDINIQIKNEDCDKDHPFICRFGKWNSFDSFYISESATNWYNARKRCQELGSELLYLNKQESIYILKRKLPASWNETLFIGLSKRIWQWGEGDNEEIKQIISHPKQHKECPTINKEGSLNVVDCGERFYALCKGGKQVDDKVMTTEGNGPSVQCSCSFKVYASIAGGFVAAVLLVNIAIAACFIWKFKKKKQARVVAIEASNPTDTPRAIEWGNQQPSEYLEPLSIVQAFRHTPRPVSGPYAVVSHAHKNNVRYENEDQICKKTTFERKR